MPDAARWDDELAKFVLPYELVRADPNPDAGLLDFLQHTYEAPRRSGAGTAHARTNPCRRSPR
jgi:hypothetical protein